MIRDERNGLPDKLFGRISNMNIFRTFRHPPSAPLARERLQILLSDERAARGTRDLLAILREDILAAVAKHVSVDQQNVQVQMGRGARGSVLEIEVEIPNVCSLAARSRAVISGDRRAARRSPASSQLA
jgi:cell division topological specificity factor